MAFLSYTIQPSQTLRRLGRYLTIGTMGTVIDFALFTALRFVLGVPVLAANTTSYGAGIINNFVLHRRWTYGGKSRKSIGLQFAQFAVVSLSALMVNNVLMLVLSPRLGLLFPDPAAGELLAKVYATGLGICLNYNINHYWTFRDAGEESR